jgi:hypothetical protein
VLFQISNFTSETEIQQQQAASSKAQPTVVPCALPERPIYPGSFCCSSVKRISWKQLLAASSVAQPTSI